MVQHTYHIYEPFLLLSSLPSFLCCVTLREFDVLLGSNVDHATDKATIFLQADVTQILVAQWGEEK